MKKNKFTISGLALSLGCMILLSSLINRSPVNTKAHIGAYYGAQAGELVGHEVAGAAGANPQGIVSTAARIAGSAVAGTAGAAAGTAVGAPIGAWVGGALGLLGGPGTTVFGVWVGTSVGSWIGGA